MVNTCYEGVTGTHCAFVVWREKPGNKEPTYCLVGNKISSGCWKKNDYFKYCSGCRVDCKGGKIVPINERDCRNLDEREE
jgi:hypothetical protein